MQEVYSMKRATSIEEQNEIRERIFAHVKRDLPEIGKDEWKMRNLKEQLLDYQELINTKHKIEGKALPETKSEAAKTQVTASNKTRDGPRILNERESALEKAKQAEETIRVKKDFGERQKALRQEYINYAKDFQARYGKDFRKTHPEEWNAVVEIIAAKQNELTKEAYLTPNSVDNKLAATYRRWFAKYGIPSNKMPTLGYLRYHEKGRLEKRQMDIFSSYAKNAFKNADSKLEDRNKKVFNEHELYNYINQSDTVMDVLEEKAIEEVMNREFEKIKELYASRGYPDFDPSLNKEIKDMVEDYAIDQLLVYEEELDQAEKQRKKALY